LQEFISHTSSIFHQLHCTIGTICTTVAPPNQTTPACQLEDSVKANVRDNLQVDHEDIQAGAENEQEEKILSETVNKEPGHVMVEDTNVVDGATQVLAEPVPRKSPKSLLMMLQARL
jgi:hypothetical protein